MGLHQISSESRERRMHPRVASTRCTNSRTRPVLPAGSRQTLSSGCLAVSIAPSSACEGTGRSSGGGPADRLWAFACAHSSAAALAAQQNSNYFRQRRHPACSRFQDSAYVTMLWYTLTDDCCGRNSGYGSNSLLNSVWSWVRRLLRIMMNRMRTCSVGKLEGLVPPTRCGPLHYRGLSCSLLP